MQEIGEPAKLGRSRALMYEKNSGRRAEQVVPCFAAVTLRERKLSIKYLKELLTYSVASVKVESYSQAVARKEL